MNKYKIGKDIGGLLERVKMLENSKNPCGCSDSNETNVHKQKGVSDYYLFESLKSAAPNHEVFEILKRLVIDAGDLTIRDLFACSTEDVGKPASDAITLAKTIGFLKLSNDKCCHEVDDPFTDDVCKKKEGGWCGRIKTATKMRCTLASDKC